MTNRKRVMPPRKYQYERRCRGTVFFRNGAMRSSHSKRSSSQLRALRRKLISGLPATAHKNLVAANLHLEAFQGAWRRGNGTYPHQAGDGKPRLIFWEVTKGCNLRCIHGRASATELSSPTDLSTRTALGIIDQIAEAATPILVLSGGEPLYRSDIFQLARYATDKGLRVALATNGTLVTKHVARMIVDAGVKRVSISLDGADALTHDSFRGIPGAFDAAVYGLRNLKVLGMSVQINMTIARHNARQLPQVLELAKSLGADALHTFLLVPVGCGVDIAAEQMVAPEEYEEMLNWFYDQSLEGGIELKATCAPHYFRVVRQRRVADRRAAGAAPKTAAAETAPDATGIGPTAMAMPGATGILLKTQTTGQPRGHAGG